MDPAALDALKVAKEVASEWERIVQPGMSPQLSDRWILIPDQMSIRRKTCETTSLLYEAALKTNLSEQPDRPNNVNPTAGVRMREKYGNSVFVPDTSKPGGGVWIASSRDEMLQAGLPQGDQVLKEDYPKRVTGTLDQTALHSNGYKSVTETGNGRPDFNIADQDALQGMQNTTNVNPNINDVGIPIDPNLPMGGGGQHDVCRFLYGVSKDWYLVIYGFDQFRRVWCEFIGGITDKSI
jgi:hypothetical protein